MSVKSNIGQGISSPTFVFYISFLPEQITLSQYISSGPPILSLFWLDQKKNFRVFGGAVLFNFSNAEAGGIPEIMKYSLGHGIISREVRRQPERQYAAGMWRLISPGPFVPTRGLGKFNPILYPGCPGRDSAGWPRPFSPSWPRSSRNAYACPGLSSTASARGCRGSIPFP